VRGRRFNPSTIVGKAPDPVKANQSDQIQAMRDEYVRRMKAKDAELDRKDAEIKKLRNALEDISDCPSLESSMEIARITLNGSDDSVDLDHLPENNYA
jgi:hypothetical protein